MLHPLNRPDVLDELVVFQGATYFRALWQGHRYGLSARAIAVNTAGEGPEEFPRFRDFWVRRPDSNDPRLKLIGLFDSPWWKLAMRHYNTLTAKPATPLYR